MTADAMTVTDDALRARLLYMRTMKPVAKIGVIRFRIGTEAIPAMTSPDKNTVNRFARRKLFASAGGKCRIAASSKYSRPSR